MARERASPATMEEESPEPGLYPSKRLRVETLTLDPSPPARSKGKEKMEDPAADGAVVSDHDVDDETCGICLSDGGGSLRGRIDSCDHFFCFVCIMEWAKIESRCPACKRRFRSIRRPTLPGVFACERVVEVPKRDQVYHPLGNESTAQSDPYEHVNCSTCNSSANEDLLLLCDLCDSATHTYCAGLGLTIPEGDWYCSDCAVSRDAHTKIQSEPLVSSSEIVSDAIASYSPQNISSFPNIHDFDKQICDERLRRGTSQTAYSDFTLYTEHSLLPTIPAVDTLPVEIASESTVSVMEIVSEEQITDDKLPSRSSTSQRTSQASVLRKEKSSSRIVPVEKTIPSTRAKGIDKGQRTLSRCRNLQSRIRQLRENWNALRTGSVAFSSSLSNGNRKCDGKLKKSVTRSNMSRPPASTSVNPLQTTSDVNASTKKHNIRNSQDVSRAWKMMEIAKSIPSTKRSTIPNHPVNNCSNVSKDADNRQSSSFVPKVSIFADKVASSTEPDDVRNISLQAMHSKCKSPIIKKQKSDTKTMEMQQICRPRNTLLSGYSDSASTKQDKFSLKEDCYRKEEPAHQQLLDEIPISFGKWDPQAYPCSIACSLPESSSLSSTMCTRFECSKVEAQEGNQGAFMDGDESSIQRNNILKYSKESTDSDSKGRSRTVNNTAKSEVQSLVKLNLKLLSRDLQLAADQFKEVARVSTHTILAACGLENSKTSAYSSSSICRHTKHIKEIRKSSLMPDSCRECFYTFVKDVVYSVLSERNLIPNSH